MDTRPKILVVDDVASNVQILGEVLMEDYNVVAATDGETALVLAAQDEKPDLIILDVLMNDLNGYDVCTRLKANAATRHIPVIFVTELNDEINEERGLELGAVDYIQKPFSPAVVRARVKIHLELKQHREFLELLLEQRTEDLKAAHREALQRLRDIVDAK